MTRADRLRLLAIARGRGPADLCLLEGPKAVRDALPTGAVVEVWIREEAEDSLGRLARERGLPVGTGRARDFERLGRTVTPQGAVAVIRDPARPLADLAALPGLLLWLDGVQDPGNVGALFRSAAAFGAAGVLAGAGSAAPVGAKALRASAGTALRLPFARDDAERIAAAVAGRPVWLLDTGGADLFAAGPAPERLVLVLGSEGHGAGAAARAAAARTVAVPIRPEVESLNVAVAGSVALAWLLRSAA